MIKKIGELPDWNARVELALDSYEGDISERKKLEEGLFTLKVRLQDLSAFHPTEELVLGQIHLIKPIGSSKYDNCGLVSVRINAFSLSCRFT